MGADLLLDIDPETFWDDTPFALQKYVGPPPTPELITSVEQELGRRLPASYVAMMRRHNGGIPRFACFPTSTRTTWAADHIAIAGIAGIGRSPGYSLCGEYGSQLMLDEWGYPDLGIYFAHCPSGGHDMVALDYRECGPQGEPQVVHVDQEWDYAVTVLAGSFAEFIRGLRAEEEFPAE